MRPCAIVMWGAQDRARSTATCPWSTALHCTRNTRASAPRAGVCPDEARVGKALERRRKHVDVLGCRLVVAESLTEINDVFTFGPRKTHQVREVPLPRGLLPDLEHHLDHDVARTVDALV